METRLFVIGPYIQKGSERPSCVVAFYERVSKENTKIRYEVVNNFVCLFVCLLMSTLANIFTECRI